ncbi:MAG TPA: DUF1992 domain-containing protein [Verrucomicrobiae bacterium]|nr:DUF1992 domain-containing protein [Verrucomicrobiae bacterium]
MIGAIPIIAENRIREARERGEFDNLAGAGRPLDLDAGYDPDWWIQRKIKREGFTREEVVMLLEKLRAVK